MEYYQITKGPRKFTVVRLNAAGVAFTFDQEKREWVQDDFFYSIPEDSYIKIGKIDEEQIAM